MVVLRAALYERVSTEEQAKFGYSIRAQVDALNEYCKNNNIKIVDHYTEEGVSGGKPSFKRPQMARLLEDVKEGKIDVILFTKLDRWFRNVPEYFKVQEILNAHNVRWKAIQEEHDTTTANGEMAVTIVLAFAQNERKKTSERLKFVFANKRKNKEAFFGPNSTPFGYFEEPDEQGIRRLVKHPELQDAVQEFWDLTVKHQSVYKAGRTVNLKYGLKRTKKMWYQTAHSEIYTGVFHEVEDYCPAYVSREDWEKVQSRFIKKTPTGRVYLFSGLLRCPVCGASLSSSSVNRKLKDGTQIEYHSYRCKQKAFGLCTYTRCISGQKVEAWLLDNLGTLLKDEISRVEEERAKPKPKPKTDVAKLKEKLRKVDVRYMNDTITEQEYFAETAEIKALIKKAEAEVAMTVTDADRDISHLQEVQGTDFRSIYDTLDNEDKRRFWRALIQEIYLEDNKPAGVKFF